MRYKEFLRKVAETSEYRFRLGALVEYEGEILSTGYNKTAPIGWIHELNSICGTQKKTTHAEIDAIIKAGENLIGATLYVARILRSGELALAKPCPICMEAARRVGVSKIFYTVDESSYGEIFMNDKNFGRTSSFWP